jgi:A9-like protein
LSSHQVCGAGFAFIGFSLSMFIGLWVDNPFVTVVLRSLLIMLLFYVLGCVLFVLGQKAVQENFDTETQDILSAQETVQAESEEYEELPEVGAAEGQPNPSAEQPVVT